ncbi:MAG: pilin [Patescibacteria group bacterium]|nr:pilin [Patescibacteria group bacterium]
MSFSKITKFLSLLILISLFTAGFFNIALAQQDPSYGLDTSANSVDAFKAQVATPDPNFLSTKVGNVIGIVLSFVGVVFLILMIFAGLTWMTAAGNQEKVTKAKDLMINAIIGLVIVMAAYAITAFVGDRLI